MSEEENSLIFKQFFTVLPLVQDLVRGDITIGVCDREKYIFSLINPKIDTGVKSGMPIKPGTAIARAMEEQQLVQMRGGKEKFGVPYIGAAVPILNAVQEVIGAIAFVESVDTQDAVYEMASELAEAISTIAATTEEVSAQTEEVARISRALGQLSEDSQARVRETGQVLELIKHVAGRRIYLV